MYVSVWHGIWENKYIIVIKLTCEHCVEEPKTKSSLAHIIYTSTVADKTHDPHT